MTESNYKCLQKDLCIIYIVDIVVNFDLIMIKNDNLEKITEPNYNCLQKDLCIIYVGDKVVTFDLIMTQTTILLRTFCIVDEGFLQGC